MSKNSKFKSAEDLSIRNTIFQIETNPVAEHLKMRNKVMNLNNLQYFALESRVITELAEDENGKNLVINGEYKIPFSGKLKKGPGDVLIDEREAIVMVLTEIAKEKRKAWELAQVAEKIIESLESNMKIYEDRAKELKISVEIDDSGKGSVLASLDGESMEFDDSSSEEVIEVIDK